MAVIKKLKDGSENVVFPVTHERAVRDNSGTTLETKLQDITSTATSNLTESKSYTDTINSAMDTRVSANSQDIDDLQETSLNILDRLGTLEDHLKNYIEYAYITRGVPKLDTSGHIFTLPAGTYISGKGIEVNLQNEIVWSRDSSSILKAAAYLILDLSTLEHRMVILPYTPDCNQNEVIVAFVDWWQDVLTGQFYNYYVNDKLIFNARFNHSFISRPVFWRYGHLEIVKDRTETAKISVRVLADCQFFLTDTWVTIPASDIYIDINDTQAILLGVKHNQEGTYDLSLMHYSDLYNTDFFVITTIFYNYITNNKHTIDGRLGLISDIDSTSQSFITFSREKRIAKDWIHKKDAESYNRNVFDKQFYYNREKLLTLKFSLTDLSTLIRARTSFLYLTPNEKYFIVQNGYTEQYQYTVLNSSSNIIVSGYSTKVQMFEVPSNGIIQIMLKKSDNSEFTSEDFEILNNSNIYDLYSSKEIVVNNDVFQQDNIANLWGSEEFLDGYFYGISPYATPITYQGLTANENMTCCEVIVRPNTKLYIFTPYIMLAYLDENRNFIDGYYYIFSNSQPNIIPRVSEVPWNAKYAQISTRLSYKYETIVTECPFPSVGLESYRNVSKQLIPQSQMVHQELNRIYDKNKFGPNVNQNNLGFTGTVTINSDNHLILESNSSAYIVGLHTTIDKSTIGANVNVITTPSSGKIIRFGYYGSKVVGTGITNTDTWIDVFSNKIELYSGNITSGVLTLKGTVNLSENITVGDEIEMKIVKDSIYHHVVKVMKRYVVIGEIDLTSTVDPEDSDHELNQMRSWGAPAIWSGTDASITVNRLFFYSNCPQYAKLAIVGDSYVENMSRSRASGWVRLLEEKIGSDNLFISGQGGGSAASLLIKLPVELNLCRPKYVILHTGVNDVGTGTETQINTYKERILQLINMTKAVNSIPILITTPRVVNGGKDDLNFITVINPWIKSLGYKYVDIAYCLSTGDGITMDTNRMRPDLVHPNHIGAEAILNWVESNLHIIL